MRAPALPAAFPRTTTQLLLAIPAHPLAHTRQRIAAAWQVVAELIEFLPQEQQGLRAQFTLLKRQLEQFEGNAQHWWIPADQLRAVRENPPPSWGEEHVQAGAPVATEPAPANHQDEPVFGFATQWGRVQEHLAITLTALATTPARNTATLHSLYLAGRMTYGADAARHLAAMFTAAVWDFERPAMPPLPSAAGRIELRSGPRAAPQTRWARYARLMFQQDRVEVTTDQGFEVVGGDEPIAYLMHVAPPNPTTAQDLAEPAERYAPVPRYEDLGAIHFCSADGHSLGAVAVADWLAQPDLVVAQPRWSSGAAPGLSVHTQVVWPLEASGVVAGAAVLRVPIRRGVAHPPMHDSVRTTPTGGRSGSTGAYQATAHTPTAPDPDPQVRLLRPAPHLQPYAGRAATRPQAHRRRIKKRFEVGPATPAQPWLQYVAPVAIVLGGLGLALSNRAPWFATVSVLIALLAAVEPWAWWSGQWLLDRDWRRMVAVYRPGASAHATRQFAQRAELRFDGANIGVRGAAGHEAWVAAASDQDLGVVTLLRLKHDGVPWAFAFTDRLGRWRLVLPAAEWAPGGDLTGLAAFAQRAGLDLGDEHLPVQELHQFGFGGQNADTVRRSRGPHTRSMIWLSGWAAGTSLVTLGASGSAHQMFLLSVVVLSSAPVLIRSIVRRWLQAPAGRRGKSRPAG